MVLPASPVIQALEALGWVLVPVIQLGRVGIGILQRVGLPKVVAVTPELVSELKFPLGSSVSRVLFRCHPYDEIRYLPAAEYNTYILKDKIAELGRVMISAGATSFQITANTATTADLALDAAGMVSGSLKSKRKGATKVDWCYIGTGQNTGTLPDNLFWFNHEKIWQTIWESAVYRRAKSHVFEISQDANHELSWDLAEKFTRAGFTLGGHFHRTGSSSFKVKVSFATK